MHDAVGATCGRLEQCVQVAEEALQSPPRFAVSGVVRIDPPAQIAEVATDTLTIVSRQPDEIVVRLNSVPAFDQADAATEVQRRIVPVLDVLSCQTNSRFALVSLGPGEPAHLADTSKDHVRQAAPENWIEGHPLVSSPSALALENSGVALLEALASDDDCPDVQKLAASAHHFHAGLWLETEIYSSGVGSTVQERAVVSYVSALEVASLAGASANFKACPQCGQPQHKISARVRGLLEAKASGAAKYIHSFYAVRSSFLHNGALASTRACAGTIIPQLDRSSSSGVASAVPLIPMLNIREITSYCVRRITDD